MVFGSSYKFQLVALATNVCCWTGGGVTNGQANLGAGDSRGHAAESAMAIQRWIHSGAVGLLVLSLGCAPASMWYDYIQVVLGSATYQAHGGYHSVGRPAF